jgi:hypothetical protein
MENFKEENILIALRVPPGDKFSLVGDSKKVVYNSLTATLEAYFTKTQFEGEYRLDPRGGKLYAIEVNEVEIEEKQPQEYGIYGEIKFRQGA